MKFVGLFITLHIGLHVVRELWHVACDKSNSIVSEVSYIHILRLHISYGKCICTYYSPCENTEKDGHV